MYFTLAFGFPVSVSEVSIPELQVFYLDRNKLVSVSRKTQSRWSFVGRDNDDQLLTGVCEVVFLGKQNRYAIASNCGESSHSSAE